MSELLHQVLRFGIAGLFNTAVTLAVFLLLDIILPYWAAYSLVFGLGILLSAYLSSRLVFGNVLTFRALSIVIGTYFSSYILGLILLSQLVETLAWQPTLAIIVVIAVTTIVNFAGSRFAFVRQQPLVGRAKRRGPS